jgi:hypothetical protein
VQRGQPGVARRDAIVTLGLKECQELANLLGGEVADG